MEDSDRAVIFGRDAVAYDAARPEYPPELVNFVLARNGPAVALEIGAGTGKATAAFAPRVERTICLEPSPEMAQVLTGRNLPGVEVEVVSFESWNGHHDSIDLIYAAQSWHWVDHSIAYSKALSLLKPGGVLSLIWNVPVDRYDRFVDVYEKFAPEILTEENERIKDRDSPTWLDKMGGAGFKDVELFTHGWTSQLNPEEFRTLCSTYSDHMMIPEPRRSELLEALEEAVAASGGYFEISYEARAFIGCS